MNRKSWGGNRTLRGARTQEEMREWLGLENGAEFDPTTIATEQLEYELALNGASR